MTSTGGGLPLSATRGVGRRLPADHTMWLRQLAHGESDLNQAHGGRPALCREGTRLTVQEHRSVAIVLPLRQAPASGASEVHADTGSNRDDLCPRLQCRHIALRLPRVDVGCLSCGPVDLWLVTKLDECLGEVARLLRYG